jgi:hypothetical protein
VTQRDRRPGGHLEAKGAEVLDLVDTSILATMFVAASAA